jgi:hypothetical protein
VTLGETEWNNGIWDQGLKEELCLRKEDIQQDLQEDHKAGGREANNRNFPLDWKMNVGTFWRGRPRPKRKKRPLTN